MIKFGNINAYVNHEVLLPFVRSDTVISVNGYHRILD